MLEIAISAPKRGLTCSPGQMIVGRSEPAATIAACGGLRVGCRDDGWALTILKMSVKVDLEMLTADLAELRQVKDRKWFYEFDLPDGTRTPTDVPAEILPIHASRRDKLIAIIRDRVHMAHELTAIDFASHEGYYSIELARHFKFVRGYEIRQTSIEAAKLITRVLNVKNVEYNYADLQHMKFEPDAVADFVLLYGLIYHLENPVHVIRLASEMTRQHILIETQIFTCDISGRLEDGYYMNSRPVEGVFALSPSYPEGREGGSTNVAIVPSLNSLLFLLKTFGFSEIAVLPSRNDDYEQFRRGSRVVVYACKT